MRNGLKIRVSAVRFRPGAPKPASGRKRERLGAQHPASAEHPKPGSQGGTEPPILSVACDRRAHKACDQVAVVIDLTGRGAYATQCECKCHGRGGGR
jgi:hypothetical protein